MRVVLVLLLLLATAGCASNEPPEPDGSADVPNAQVPSTPPVPLPAPEDTAAVAPSVPLGDDDAWTTEPVAVLGSRLGAEPATLRAVRTAAQDGFDRLVFEFEGETVPGYDVHRIDPPVLACAGEDTYEVAGAAWLTIRLLPARAYDAETGTQTVEDRDRTLGLPAVQQLTNVCDFEGQVEWVAGTAAADSFRVQELTDPVRIVVDVMH